MKLSCNLANKTSYDIDVENDLLTTLDLKSLLEPYGSYFAIITDKTIAPLFGEKLKATLVNAGLETDLLAFPSGEENKNRQTKEKIEDQIFKKGWGRDTCVIALGGGVVTDLAGFIAATYCRGIPLIMIPTTLLAMVDASIGGKLGLDVPYGKNLIGAIYQPKMVLIDPIFLTKLPIEELRNGVVEMIKHGLIVDSSYFDYLESHANALLNLDKNVVVKSIYDSCRIKVNIVEYDETENSKRNLLNLGHTVAHAVEKIMGYKISHGHAVAIGILVEGYLAMLLGYLNQKAFKKIRAIFEKYNIPYTLSKQIAPDTLLEAMRLDKKTVKGRPRFVILQDIGTPLSCEGKYCMSVDDKLIRQALDWMNHDLCCH